MDAIIQDIRTNGANMILFVLPSGRIDTGLQNNLNALKECINGLSDATCTLVINKVPMDCQLEEGVPPKTLKDIQEESIKDFTEKLNVRELANNVFIQCPPSRSDPKLLEALNILYTFISNSTNVPQEGLRTWTEPLNYYQNILTGKISASQAAQSEIIRVQSRLRTLSYDATNVEGLINAVETLVPSMLIPVFNIVSTIFHQPTLGDLKKKLEDIRLEMNTLGRSLQALQNSQYDAQQQKENAEKFLSKVRVWL